MATGTKEMKTTLKNARECIKNKEYKEALKHCKVNTQLSQLFTLCEILLLHQISINPFKLGLNTVRRTFMCKLLTF